MLENSKFNWGRKRCLIDFVRKRNRVIVVFKWNKSRVYIGN